MERLFCILVYLLVKQAAVNSLISHHRKKKAKIFRIYFAENTEAAPVVDEGKPRQGAVPGNTKIE
jgi:hypothetical protein